VRLAGDRLSPTSGRTTNKPAHPDLATAMAISGAAASSYGASVDADPTALLAFSNVRLGFWSPAHGKGRRSLQDLSAC